MSSTGSVSLSGLLGGTAGSIDVPTLINQLMTAQSVPQNQLKNKLSTVQSQLSAYQAVNAQVAAVKAAAEKLTDPAAWRATAATSSSTSVVATSTADALPGSTTFSVTRLARAQVTTVAADGSGNVLRDPASGLTVTGADGAAHSVTTASGSATDVAAAINAAKIGVQASVVRTGSGTTVLQLSSAKTGAANGFAVDQANLTNPSHDVITAQDAEVTVGNPAAGGYSVTSSSNTFTGLIPGVTFSANALAADVTITVASDEKSIADKVAALVAGANSAAGVVGQATAKGAVLQGNSSLNGLATSLSSAVSFGTGNGGSLAPYGIDLDSKGALSFDATKFAAAYAADPSATKTAVTAFVNRLHDTAAGATDPTSGSLSAAINSANNQTTSLNGEIADWTTRLATIKDNLTVKFTAMQTALAKLQSQQTYLTSMFDSMTKSTNSS